MEMVISFSSGFDQYVGRIEFVDESALVQYLAQDGLVPFLQLPLGEFLRKSPKPIGLAIALLPKWAIALSTMRFGWL